MLQFGANSYTTSWLNLVPHVVYTNIKVPSHVCLEQPNGSPCSCGWKPKLERGLWKVPPPFLQTSAFQAGHNPMLWPLTFCLLVYIYTHACDLFSLDAALSLHPCKPVKFGFQWVLLEEALWQLALREIYLPISLHALNMFPYLFILLFRLPPNIFIYA